jgi:hypothetical protein
MEETDLEVGDKAIDHVNDHASDCLSPGSCAEAAPCCLGSSVVGVACFLARMKSSNTGWSNPQSPCVRDHHRATAVFAHARCSSSRHRCPYAGSNKEIYR